MTSKASLRQALVTRRAKAHGSVDQGSALSVLCDLLDRTKGPVSFYWPIRTEMDPRPVMEKIAGIRQVCLPLTHGRKALTFRAWTPGAILEPDGFGVPVPVEEIPVVPKVLVVPMLGFDASGQRLGYGAGHYDRTLEALRATGSVTAIGLAFEAQYCPEPLPTEPTDQPLDAIVTEAKLRQFIDK